VGHLSGKERENSAVFAGESQVAKRPAFLLKKN